jgi:hypothetical protein
MKKYIIQLQLIAIALTVFLFSCSEDKGNYDYVELNNVEISAIEAHYTVEQMSSLAINPKLNFSLSKDEDAFEYLWYMYSIYSKGAADTLSFEQNLDAKVEVAPDNYTVVYKITNKTSGVFYTHQFNVLVTGSFTNGLFILSEIDKKANVAMISGSEKIYEDVYFNINEKYAGKNPVGIKHIKNRYENSILIFCDDKNGGVNLEPNSLKDIGTFNDLFWVAEEYPAPKAFLGYSGDEYAITRNGLHFRDFVMRPPSKFGAPEISSVDLFPELFDRDIFYDNKNEQFIKYGDYSTGPVTNMPDSLFNPADIGMKLLCGGDGFKGNAYGLFYDSETNSYHSLISAYTFEYSKNFIPIKKIEIKTATEIDKASCFDLSSLSPQIFYAVDNKLYCLNVDTDVTKLVYSFDSNFKIDHFELVKAMNDRRMYIGTSSAEGGKTGSVHVVDVELNGSVSVLKSYENVAGRIVDFMFK